MRTPTEPLPPTDPRAASPPAPAAAGGRWLLCRIRRRLCAIPVAPGMETMRPLPAAPFGGMPPFVRGVAIIRGVPTPVVDPGSLLGCAEDPAPARFVTVRSGARTVALAVEAVIGVRELSPASLVELPPLLREAGAEALTALGTLDAELLAVLGNACWVPEPVWQALGESGPNP
jgi:purine-binding chemotaxis protein CheW